MEANEFELAATLMKFQVRSINAYMRATKALLRLELPIQLLPYEPGMTPAELVESVNVARTVLSDLPMDEFVRSTLRIALLSWMSGIGLAALASEHEELWAAEGAVLSTKHTEDLLDLAQGLLDGDIKLTEDDME
ncbi:hypothetical protein F5X71_00325 [Nocardia brasiliensis]|uniref:Uncharacterized protein n=1 Tax=Nocardia brasiliensis TaxID=37326 RepID=A0A6G9XJ90_NOCBR|nr:hypothetical protein [Nocardia brasiliensis]QIS00979.1 hypothetical protein F5X71_00325 [Nocardia brasiliensis]